MIYTFGPFSQSPAPASAGSSLALASKLSEGGFWTTPDVFPPHCWQAFLQSTHTALGGKLSRRPRRNDAERRRVKARITKQQRPAGGDQ